MAIIPSALYPGQIDADPAYPQGKARNSATYQDGTGTPLEKRWLNDIWGFLQALLAAGAITPSGDPDEVGASQHLEALLKLAAIKFAVYEFDTDVNPAISLGRLPLTELMQSGGFEQTGVADNVIVPPTGGNGIAIAHGTFTSSSAVEPKDFKLEIESLSVFGATLAVTTRASARAADRLAMTVVAPFNTATSLTVSDSGIEGKGVFVVVKLT